MRDAETVTFAGTGFDRAAHLRGDAEQQQVLLAEGLVLPVWRGKPLCSMGSALSWVTQGHPVISNASLLVFLGVDDGTPRFAADISDWTPDEQSLPSGQTFLDPSQQQHPDLPEGEVFCELRAVMARLSPRDAELACSAKAILQWHASHRFCAQCGQPSVPVQAGWQRSCRACNAQHFPRTDPVVIMLVTRGNSVLLGRSPGWPEGMFSCLAGFMEPGETVETAVRREVMEETGIRVGAVRYISSQPWPFPASLMIGCATEAQTEEISLDPAELEAALWVSREEMVDVFAGIHPVVRPPRAGAIAQFLLRNWLADRLD